MPVPPNACEIFGLKAASAGRAMRLHRLTRKFHTGFLRMGGTGYQPVLVGNLPTRLGQAPCRDEELRIEKLDVVLPPGW